MAKKKINGKYRVQVSLTDEEYKLIRKLAYEMEVTVNECLRICTIEASKEFVKG